ncbi:GAF and ANTAR domain-containing protein [Actinophytocola sp. NPDC049390]|uniref:GAF and ANTAR domain-containing protein n=1 Tax=Actinophytocola sp. NPDC049390 TaxID=3363894 RepID=UPI0037AABD17
MDTEQPPTDELAVVFARMSGLLMSTETVNSALEVLTALAAETITGSDGAGVTLLDEHGERITTAATDPAVTRADSLQYELDEGPCLTAWAQRITVHVDDVTLDERWPRWASAAAATGMRAALSTPLVAGDTALGALKVYSRSPGAYGARHEHLLAMFAAHAAVLLTHVRSHEDARRVSARLAASLRTRDLVNIAKGVLMVREGVDEQAAFLLLSRTAADEGTSLRAVAATVVGSTTRRGR